MCVCNLLCAEGREGERLGIEKVCVFVVVCECSCVRERRGVWVSTEWISERRN